MTNKLSVWMVAALLVAAPACGGDGPVVEVQDGGRGAGDTRDDIRGEPSGLTKEAGVDESDECVPVWSESSQRIAISSFGFHLGSSGYEIGRSDMTAEQLRILEGLCQIPTPTGLLGADYASHRVTITDQDGESVTYRAASENVIDSDEGEVGAMPTLEIASLTPFLATFRCTTAREFGPREDTGTRWDGSPQVNTDPGCSHGVFVSCGAQEVSLRKLHIDQPGRYRVSTERCFQAIELRIFAEDGTTRLAEVGPSSAPDCPSLTYDFATPGLYPIEIVKTDVGGTPRCGDFFLKIAREAP